MQRRDLTSRCMMQREVKLQFKYLSDFKNKFEKNLYFEAGSKAGTFDIKKTEVENFALLSLSCSGELFLHVSQLL
jgi:hypothetical protein